MNKKTIISATDKTIHKLKVLAEEKKNVGSKLMVTAEKLNPKAKEIAVTDKENDLYKNKNTIISAPDNTILKLKVEAKDLAMVAEKNESIRLKLEITAKQLAATAAEKEDIRSKLAVTAEEKEEVRQKLVVTAKELALKAEQLAQTAKEKEEIRVRLETTAIELAATAQEKEDVRKKLEVTAEELRLKAEALAVIAEEKEDIRLKLVMTTDKLVRVEKLAVLGKLAGIMGHEIRNPLGVIRNSIYFLTMKFKESMDEKVKSHMDILQTEINICDKIIYDVLEFARTKPSFFTQTEINSMVEAVLSKADIPEIVKVQTDLGENLPKLNIDSAQIQQVFSNIVYNAIEAMPNGGQLSVTTLQTDTSISIAFKDTGVGIPKENTSKIFEPLFSTKAKGLGLGLVACQNIINAHHGKIGFESKEGQGTTFTVTLPISKN